MFNVIHVEPDSEAGQCTPEAIDVALRKGRFELDKYFSEPSYVSAFELLRLLNNELNVKVPVRELIKARTMDEIYSLIDRFQRCKAGVVRSAGGEQKIIFPVTAQQRSLIQKMMADSKEISHNGLYKVIKFHGSINSDAIFLSIRELIRRHEALRTKIEFDEDEPVQVVVDEASIEIERSISSEVCCEEDLLERMQQLISKPFNIPNDILFRAHLLTVSKETCFVVIVFLHHISDGWSASQVERELLSFYEAYASRRELTLAEPQVQYGDYALWQREWMESSGFSRKEKYWQPRLLGIKPLFSHLGASSSMDGVSFLASGDRLEKIKEFCGLNGVPVSVFFLTVYMIFLSEIDGERDVAVTAPFSRRNKILLRDTFGYLSHPLILRTVLPSDLGFAQCMELIKDVFLDAFSFQDFVVSWRQIDDAAPAIPIFVYHPPVDPVIKAGGIEVSDFPFDAKQPVPFNGEVFVRLYLIPADHEIKISFVSNVPSVKPVRFEEKFNAILEGLMGN